MCTSECGDVFKCVCRCVQVSVCMCSSVCVDTGCHTHLVIPTRYCQYVPSDRPAGMPHYIIKGTENLQGESSGLVGLFLLAWREKNAFAPRAGLQGERKGERKTSPRRQVVGLKPLVNALRDKLTSEFHFPPVFSSLLQMITLQSWKEGAKEIQT